MGLVKRNHIYSYSQLQSVDECPYSFYLQKIEHADGMVQNAFAQQGTLIHDILDKWAKGQLQLDELVDEYKRRYPDEVTERWPKMLASKGYTEKAYQLGIDYFSNFHGFDGYEIVSTEQMFRTKIHDRPFVGVIDAILKNKQSKKLVVLDHKSKSLSAFKKAEDEMYRQQLLYSKYVYETYGSYPETLMFNLFKENGTLMKRDFTKESYEEAIKWASEQIDKIEQFDMLEWLQTKDSDFFCQELCSCRKICPNGKVTYKKK